MADLEQPQKQKVTPTKFYNEFSAIEWGALILIILAIPFYISLSTKLVPNFSVDETRVFNGITYPANTSIYSPNDFVPKSNFSNTQAFFVMFINGICIFILLQKRLGDNKRATINEAMRDIAKQIIEAWNIKDARIAPTRDGLQIISPHETIDIQPVFNTKYKTVDGVRSAVRYCIQIIRLDKEDRVPTTYRAHYHPHTRYWDGMFKSKLELSEMDKCPNCGSEADEKVVSSEDLAKMSHAKKLFGGR